MLKFLPILLPILYAVVLYQYSAWRTARILDTQSRPLEDATLKKVLARLAEVVELEQIKVFVYEIEPVNGLAAPDGRIFLTRGFLNRYEAGQVTAEELAGVVAHELGHVAMGHTKRRMIDVTGQNAIFFLLAGALGRIIPFVGIWIARSLSVLLAAGLSRRDEFEADAYASALLVKAGIGTAPQKSLFHKLDALTGAASREIPHWLRSHPKATERIRAIEEREARWSQA